MGIKVADPGGGVAGTDYLSPTTTVDPLQDLVIVYDDSAGELRSVNPNNVIRGVAAAENEAASASLNGFMSSEDKAKLDMMGIVGVIYTNGGSTAQTGINGTPAKVTGFASNGTGPVSTTPDHTNDQITLGVDGEFEAFLALSFSGSSNETFTFRVVCTGDGTVEGGGIVRKIGSGGDIGQSATKVKISGASSGDIISVEVSSDGSNDSITIAEATLLVESSG